MGAAQRHRTPAECRGLMSSGSHLGGGVGGEGRGGGLGGMGGTGDSTGGFSFFSRPHPLLPPAATLMIPKDEFGERPGMSGDDELGGAYLPRFCPRPEPDHVARIDFTILHALPTTCCTAIALREPASKAHNKHPTLSEVGCHRPNEANMGQPGRR